MIDEKNLKLFILNRIAELDKKIRFIEDLGSSNCLNIKEDVAYTTLVGMRLSHRELLNYIGEICDNKKSINRGEL